MSSSSRLSPRTPTRVERFQRAARVSLRRTSGNSRQLAVLCVGSLTLAAGIAIWPESLPISLLTVPLVVGNLVLGPRELPWFVVITVGGLALALPRQPVIDSRIVLGVAVVFSVGFIILLTGFRRSRLGVAGSRGESMFVDLRERILRQDGLSALPTQWYGESALRSAGGTPFAGDFVVSTRTEEGIRLEVAVVDVSGKGEEAGTRALLLSGAFGALLGALPPEEFLPAANDYLLRQEWDEGFATAVHLSLDLETGEFEVRSAGHPPALHLTAGSGRWAALETSGPALGLIDAASFVNVRGVMRRNDVILLYTDGMVEAPHRDLTMGIDRLLGHAERTLHSGYDHGAGRLIDMLGSRNDDRALVLIARR